MTEPILVKISFLGRRNKEAIAPKNTKYKKLVFFDKDGESHKELESKKVKGVSFMAFDILFGPETIDVSSDGAKIIGQGFSFIVPEDGKLRTMPWTYLNRYNNYI